MKVECPRPTCPAPLRWKATGEAGPNRWGRMRAEFHCEGCGRKFSSGLQDAITACNIVRAANGLEPVAFGIVRTEPKPAVALPLSVPMPSVPMPIVRQQRGGFASVGTIAADFKARQSGEREPGEDDGE